MSSTLSKWYHSKSVMFALAAIAWVGALIALISYCPKYVPDANKLLSTDFEGIHKKNGKICTKNFGCWICTEDGVLLVEKAGFRASTGVRLTPAGTWGAFMLWDLKDPKRFDFLEFQGRMRVANINIGEESWDMARALLYFKDWEGKRRFDYPHTAKGLSGSSPWIEFSKVFPVPDFAVSAHLMIQNSAKSGTMWIDDISLRPARINHQFFRNRNILLSVGAILALIFFIKLKIWEDFGWIILVVFVVSAFGALCPTVYIEKVADNLNIRVEVLKKIGHFMVFLAMGTLSSLWLQRRSAIRDHIGMSIYHGVCLFAALALFAAVTEFLQLLTIDRTPALVDYLIDLSGIFSGVLLGFMMTRTW